MSISIMIPGYYATMSGIIATKSAFYHDYPRAHFPLLEEVIITERRT